MKRSLNDKPVISSFNSWFSSSYFRLRDKLARYPGFNEDAFHDTYMAIHRNLLFERSGVGEFEPYFMGCYRNIFLRNRRHERQYSHPEDLFFQLLSDKESIPVEELLAPGRLAYDIRSFVKKKFPQFDSRLWGLKVVKTMCSYRDLSDYTGVPAGIIRRKVNTITHAVRENSGFMRRHSQLITND